MNRKIFLSTGEVSGDLHGSLLANALFSEAEKRLIDLEIYGLGGERMRKEGVKILQDTTSISAIGIWEALPLVIPTLKVQKRFYKSIKNYSPHCLVLIDYMGPNIKIGRKLRNERNKIPIYYYIAPQEWAWRVGNNSTTDLIGFSDRIFAIFKQEANFYKKRGGNVLWIGHPMIDLIKKLKFNPSTPYAVSHSAIDFHIRSLGKEYDFPYLIGRFANFYGGSKKSTKEISKSNSLYTFL